ncbi:MAG: TetR/AcrR family transcriptional regulator [Bacteroidales bacterium]|nr:TetR/AcrR family transcriptional regulator [Bacteroidales bacterium]
MDKKQIQEQRIKGYFIQATKEIIKGEGIRSLNVRNIADKAGYSYATLYNYFKDAKDLIFECVNDFQDECQLHVNDNTGMLPAGPGRIKAVALAYASYFIEYPGIFELFFIEKPYNVAGKQPTLDVIYGFLDKLCNDDWEYCRSNNLFTNAEINIKSAQLRFNVTGMLLLYLNRRYITDYKEFMNNIGEQISAIIDR